MKFQTFEKNLDPAPLMSQQKVAEHIFIEPRPIKALAPKISDPRDRQMCGPR